MTDGRSCSSYLLLGEQGCVDHFHLDRDQSQGLKRQAPPVPVVVLKTRFAFQESRPSPPGPQSSQDFCPSRYTTLSPSLEEVFAACRDSNPGQDWVWTSVAYSVKRLTFGLAGTTRTTFSIRIPKAPSS